MGRSRGTRLVGEGAPATVGVVGGGYAEPMAGSGGSKPLIYVLSAAHSHDLSSSLVARPLASDRRAQPFAFQEPLP
jgi:hypothetical protein